MAEGDRIQCPAQFGVINGALPLRVGEHCAQIPERKIGHLGQEHRLIVAVGAQHRAGGIRPQPGDAAQQRGPSAARRPGDHQRFARTESQVEVAQQNLAIGVANLDVAQLN